MFIVGDKSNQLCNRLCVYRDLMAAAIELNHTLSIPFFEDYAKYFRGSQYDTFCTFPKKRVSLLPATTLSRKIFQLAVVQFLEQLKRRPRLANLLRASYVSSDYESILSGNSGGYDLASPEFRDMARSSNFIILSGPLFRVKSQNWRKKHANLIRSYFEPVNDIRTKVDSLLVESRSEAAILIGVHIRRGDYATFFDGRYFYSHAQYAELIFKIQHLFTTWHKNQPIKFLLSSNEFIPSEPFHGLNHLILNGSAVQDLYTLAGCDYLIGPPSTFGHWASWHGLSPRYTISDPSYTPLKSDFVECF